MNIVIEKKDLLNENSVNDLLFQIEKTKKGDDYFLKYVAEIIANSNQDSVMQKIGTLQNK